MEIKAEWPDGKIERFTFELIHKPMNNKPDMPDEIYTNEMSPNRYGRHGGWSCYKLEDLANVPYIRKDIHEAVKQERDRYKEALEYILKCPSGSSVIFRTVKQALKGENE